MMKIYLNGEFMPLEEARVPVLDRGFLFGDGVYEVIPVYGGHPFRLIQHLDRLERSLRETRIPLEYSLDDWMAIFQPLIDSCESKDCGIYLQVTRGVAIRDHSFPKAVEPTIFAMINPIKPVPAKVLENGVHAIAREDIRWSRCDIKSISLIGNVLMRQEAVESDAAETILIRDGMVTEGSASNVFIVKSGEVITPPKDEHLLGGITRDLVLELCVTHGLAVREAPIREQMLRAADEVWVTSSTKEILPVTVLDGQLVGEGKPGPVWHTLVELYGRCKQALRQGEQAC
jgi:D-alanine transaminase